MQTNYQLIVIGAAHPLRSRIITTFIERIKDLGLSEHVVTIIHEHNFDIDYKKNSPTVALYFGRKKPFKDVRIIKQLIKDAVFVLPIVQDLDQVRDLLPKILKSINAFEFKGSENIESLVSRALEALSLLRTSRRLFISYRRMESRSIAIQLYEFLDQRGFDVFLDTHSIREGEPFQDELWHRLVDTDVVVLLDTPGFLTSEWTAQELAKASAMSVGVLQIIWPSHKQNPYSTLCFPLELDESNFEHRDFNNKKAQLTDHALNLIGSEVESLRARSLAARQDNLIQEFTSTARKMKVNSSLHPEKFISVRKRKGRKEMCIIPTVGVPHAFTYNQSEELIKRIRSHHSKNIYLLYDHRNILKKWQAHLTWLDTHLPVKAIKITEIENWMKNL